MNIKRALNKWNDLDRVCPKCGSNEVYEDDSYSLGFYMSYSCNDCSCNFVMYANLEYTGIEIKGEKSEK